MRTLGGLCGWMGMCPKDGSADGVLARMSAAGRTAGDASVEQVLLPDAALAVFGSRIPVSLYREAGILTAVQGRVQWVSEDLAALAAARGAAAAAAVAYARHGLDCLQALRGPFALAILDIAHGIGLLAVDRMGIRTLCYANPHGKLVFGPTTDSVIAYPEVTRELSDQGIFNYLYCHTVPSPGTVYKAVQKLLPGECVIFRNGRIERKSYWRLEYADETAPGTALEERFHSLLRESIARAVNGDRAGAFLSGGTDSSTVTGILSEIQGRPVDTYSIGFAADGFDEMDYARITARHFGARAHEYYVTPQDVVDAIPLIAQHYDEPFGNDSAVPTYYCARLAREDGIEVMLAGDGGDEIFGGNVRYAKQKIFEYYGLIPQAVRRGLIEPLVFSMPAADKLPPLRKVKSYIRQANVPLPDRLETYNFLHRQPLAEIFEADFLARVDAQGPLRQMREVYRSTLSDSAINRMLHLDLKQTLADNDLRKVSRMCDAAGVEVRYPLIDEALVEFSGQLPASLKVKGLKLRYFFKQALRDFLPPQTIAKSKHGFGVPFGVWMKEYKPLRELTLSSLEALQHRGYIKPSYVRQVLHAHQTGHATYFGKMIWVMTMLERWLAARDL